MNIIKRREHMLKSKGKEHILNINKQKFLSPLQRKILLFLAVNYPADINETVKAIKGNYRSSWDAFKELEKKNLIKPVKSKRYRGRDYDQFWLSANGILIAMSEKVKSKILLRKAQDIYPEKRGLHFLIEVIPVLGESAFDMLFLAVVNKGKFDDSDLISIFASQKKLSNKEIRKYHSILERYPELHQQHVDYIKKASKNLKDLSELFKI